MRRGWREKGPEERLRTNIDIDPEKRICRNTESRLNDRKWQGRDFIMVRWMKLI